MARALLVLVPLDGLSSEDTALRTYLFATFIGGERKCLHSVMELRDLYPFYSFTLLLSFRKSHMKFPPIQDPTFAQIMGQRFQRVKFFHVAILDQQPPLLHTL